MKQNSNSENMDHYVVYRSTSPSFIPETAGSIGVVLHPETTFTDYGVLATGQSYYYLVMAVDWAQNKSAKLNMGYVFTKFVNENTAATDKNWVSFPYVSEYDSVKDLTSDLSPAGDPLTKITNLRDEQLYENWTFTTVPFPRWTGTNFAIEPGRGYEFVTITDTIWNSKEYSNDIGSASLEHRAILAMDVETHVGMLTESDRGPLWVVDQTDKVLDTVPSANTGAQHEFAVSGLRLDATSNYQMAALGELVSERRNRTVKSIGNDYREVGTSHLVRGYCELNGCEHLIFTACRPDRPFDALTENIVGCVVQ